MAVAKSFPHTRSEEDRRELILWAVAARSGSCQRSSESVRRTGVRAALEVARAFARGEVRVGVARQAAVTAHAVAVYRSLPGPRAEPGTGRRSPGS